MAAGTLRLNVVANIKSFLKNLKRSNQKTKAWSKRMRPHIKRIARAFKLVTASIKKMVGVITVQLQRATVAFGAFVAASLYAYGKQEKAEFRLAAALKATGELTAGRMKQLKAYAAAIQRVTTVGDEETIALMQLGSSLGVTADRLDEATTMAIGLSNALGLDANSMMKYVALAEQAEFTMLQRYIPALRSVTTAEEKAAILRETAAKGFQVARAEAMTFSGVLEQLKNVAGDAMEQVGGGIASVLHGPMNQLKNWIIENEKMFIQWGRVIGSVIRSAFSYIKQLYDIVRDSGWSDALSKLGADIKEALKISIDYIKPYAKEIGAAIADGLKNSVASIDWGKIIGKFILGTPRRVKTVFDMIGGTAVEGGMAAKDYLADMAKSMFNVEKEMKKLNGGV